jgi:hypothetical protein
MKKTIAIFVSIHNAICPEEARAEAGAVNAFFISIIYANAGRNKKGCHSAGEQARGATPRFYPLNSLGFIAQTSISLDFSGAIADDDVRRRMSEFPSCGRPREWYLAKSWFSTK